MNKLAEYLREDHPPRVDEYKIELIVELLERSRFTPEEVFESSIEA